MDKEENESHDGFFITVQDHTTSTFHKYILEDKDSVNIIFNKFFDSELELGEIDRPISIYNGKLDFYIARVYVIKKPNGEKSFKNLKYPSLKLESKKNRYREQLEIIYM